MSIDPSAFDLIEGQANAFKFDNIGDTCKGRIVKAVTRQQTDTNDKPRFFPSGDPMMMLVVTVEQDDGTEAALYFKGGKFTAASGTGQGSMEAFRTALNGQKPEVGGMLAMQYSGIGEGERGKNAPKLYTVQYKAPVASVSLEEDLF